MRYIEEKYPASLENGGLNADSDDIAVGTNQLINAANVRWGTTDKGRTGVVEEVGGTRQLSISLPSVTFITIGSAEDVENARIVYFKFCVSGPWHRITCYDKQSDREYVVLLSSQVVGGLNFSKYSPIHSARVLDGLLYWTDINDTQHKLNIYAAIKMNQPDYVTDEAAYVLPIEKETISLIKRPPRLPLDVAKVDDNTVITNFLGQNAFWFAYRYFYRDKETSVISVHSVCVPYNAPADTFNAVDVTLPFSEKIDQDVQRIEIGVRADLNPQFFGVKVWDKNRASDAAAIIDHNSGTTPLSYRFYNNTVGEPWGNAYSVKPFESCPISSETLEIARNRIILANNTSGYDTPSTTSLSITGFTQEQGGTIEGYWYFITVGYGDPPSFQQTYYYLRIFNIGAQSGFYSDPSIFGPPPPTIPSTIDFNDLTFVANSPEGIIDFLGGGAVLVDFNTYNDETSEVTNAPTGTIEIANGQVYKSAAPYKYGIVFYDEYDRKCGVVTSDSLIYTTPDREFDSIEFATFANWTLSNDNRLAEIPLFAKTYSIVRSKCLRTRFFLQGRARNMGYATLDTNGSYVFSTSPYSNTHLGVGINIEALDSFSMGYLFEQGNNDLVKVYIDAVSTVYTLRVIAQQGSWIICQLKDLGSLSSSTDAFFEIYRPYIQSANEPLYEVGAKYFVLNAGTANRAYSVLSDSIRGDAYLLQRTEGGDTYYTEAMSLNDQFYQNWFDDSGRINLIDNIGQTYKPNSLVYSNTYILGSKINGLGEFEAVNEAFTPSEAGAIRKLQATSKVQNEQGIIVLAICEAQTASIYIGEVQLLGSDSNAFVAQSAGFIGTINVLKGNYGTTDPQAVVEYRGAVFYPDARNGVIVRYSSNGLFPISQFGMVRYWRQFFDKYASMTKAQIEAFGSRPYIFMGVDPYHHELLVTVPRVTATSPAGTLPDVYTTEPQNAVGQVTITGMGEVGDNILVRVIDPEYGPITLGQHTLTSGDLFIETIAKNLYENIILNAYGYTATRTNTTIFITAREGLGASMNMQNRLVVVITEQADSLLINASDEMLINNSDKLII